MLENDPPSADEDVARFRLDHRHTDLATLVDQGFVIWDRDENLVKKGPRFGAVISVSDLPDDHGGELPDGYL